MRVGETTSAHKGLAQFGGRHALGLVCIIATAAVGYWRRVPVGYLVVFALGGWLLSRVRVEQWYEAFGDFAYLLVSLAVLEIILRSIATSGFIDRRAPKALLAGTFSIFILVFHLKVGSIEGPRNYLRDLEAFGMRLEQDVPYFTSQDQQALRDFIGGVEPHRDVVVEIYPWGEGLLIEDADGQRVRFQVPYFDRLFARPEQWAWGYGPTEYPVPDLYLVRTSRYHPEWLRYREAKVLERALRKAGQITPSLVRIRDDTEAWYAIRPHLAPHETAGSPDTKGQ
jgi:hypothetical protein